MIKFDWYDADPWTGIAILKDGDVMYQFNVSKSWDDFQDFLDSEPEPVTIGDAFDLVDKFNNQ